MNGYPKHLNTKEDYLYVKENFPKEQWRQDWQDLLDSRNDWFYERDLAENEEGITDETHKVVAGEYEEEGEKKTKNMQYVLKENPTCIMNQLGITEEEVKEALA